MNGHNATNEQGDRAIKVQVKYKNKAADSPSWTLADALILNKDSNISKVGVKERTFDTRTMTRLTTTVTPPNNFFDNQIRNSVDRKINGSTKSSFNNQYSPDFNERNEYLNCHLDDKPIYSSTITISKRVYDPREKELIDIDQLRKSGSPSTNNIARLEDLIQNLKFTKSYEQQGNEKIHEENSYPTKSSDNSHYYNQIKKSSPIKDTDIPKLYVPPDIQIPKLIHPSRNSFKSASPQSHETSNHFINRGYETYHGPYMSREESYNLQRSYKIHGNSPALNGQNSPGLNMVNGNHLKINGSEYDTGVCKVGNRDSIDKNRNTGVVSRDLENLMDSIALYNKSANNEPIYSQVNKLQRESNLELSKSSDGNQLNSYKPTGMDFPDGLSDYHQGGQMRVMEGGSGQEGRHGRIDGADDRQLEGGNLVFQKGNCAACNQPINGQVLMALDKMWHLEHFLCDECRRPLGTEIFYEKEGKVFCERDYQNMHCPRCAGCNLPILEKCIKAMDRSWHSDHFRCAHCFTEFGAEGFHEMDGKPYCSRDFFAMFAPKCGMCNQPIIDNYVSALQRLWHQQCFVCMDCQSPFTNGSFYADNGRPFCERHFYAIRGSLCHYCSKPIIGLCMTAMNRKFHPDHFLCFFCQKPITKGIFKEQQDKPYCHECFDKIFG